MRGTKPARRAAVRRQAPTPEDEAMAKALEETRALEALRGGAVVGPERRGGPYERLDGLSFLRRKGRLSPREAAAGLRYGDLYRRALLKGRVKSGLDDRLGGHSALNAAEAGLVDMRRLNEARQRGLAGAQALIAACDQICGEGRRARELAADERQALRVEERLIIGLDMLASWWGIG